MTYRLRYQNHDLELVEGEFVIGRSETCQLAVDDPLVSRRHAALVVRGNAVTVRDLGSRNGIRLNGAPVEGEVSVVHGDVIRVGSQEFVLLSQSLPAEAPSVALTQRGDALGMLGELAEKALGLGKGEEAERLLGNHLQRVLEGVPAGTVSPELVDRAAHFGARIALSTGRAAWFDFVVKLYVGSRRAAPAEVVDQLHLAVRKVQGPDRELLRAWLEILRERAAEAGPAERFVAGRIESLARMAALR